MNVRLDSVISNIMGRSELTILDTIVEGDREPAASGDVAESPHQGFGGSGGCESGRDMPQGASDDPQGRSEALRFHRSSDRDPGADHSSRAESAGENLRREIGVDLGFPCGNFVFGPELYPRRRGLRRNSLTGRAWLAQDLLGRGFDGDSDHRGRDDTSGRHRIRSRFDLFLPDARTFLFLLGLAPGKYINGDRQLRSKGRTPVNRMGQALNHRPCLRGTATGGAVVDIVLRAPGSSSHAGRSNAKTLPDYHLTTSPRFDRLPSYPVNR